MRFLYRSRRKGKQLREAKRQMKLSRQTSVGVWNDKLASNKPEYTFETRAPFSLYVYTLGDSKRKKKRNDALHRWLKKKKRIRKKKFPKNPFQTSSFVSRSFLYAFIYRQIDPRSDAASDSWHACNQRNWWKPRRNNMAGRVATVAINNPGYESRSSNSKKCSKTGWMLVQRLFLETERKRGIPCTHRPWFLLNRSFSCLPRLRK